MRVILVPLLLLAMVVSTVHQVRVSQIFLIPRILLHGIKETANLFIRWNGIFDIDKIWPCVLPDLQHFSDSSNQQRVIRVPGREFINQMLQFILAERALVVIDRLHGSHQPRLQETKPQTENIRFVIVMRNLLLVNNKILP
jgi:hypothetical protein